MAAVSSGTQRGLPQRVFAPGQVMAYSSWDYALLGYILESTAGMPYEQVIATHLLEPLGMHRSTYEQPVPDRIKSIMADGYGVSKDGSYNIVPHDFVRMSPGVALVTTAEDMGKFMHGLLQDADSRSILTRRSRDLLLTRQAAAHAYSRGRTLAFSELNISGRQVLYHDGNGIGFTNRLVLAPDHGFGLFISVNHRGFDRSMSGTPANTFVKELSARVVEACLSESDSSSIPDLTAIQANSSLKQFEGYYRLAQVTRTDLFRVESLMNNVRVWVREGQLHIGSSQYKQIEPMVFQHATHPQAIVVFIASANDEIRFLTFGGTGSYEKVSVLESSPYQMALVALCAFILLLMVVSWPFRRKSHWLFWTTSLFNLGFLIGVGLVFSGAVDLLLLFKTIPLGMQLLFVMPWISGVFTLILIAIYTRTLFEHRQFTWTSLIQGSVIIACLALFWFAQFWNLTL